ncbi:MAG: FAA hydrolase family protein [Pedosphaera sp.]|nr:FAA hydrolase family protein [Pedosphaera sp.]
MRLCRFNHKATIQAGFFLDDRVVPMDAVSKLHRQMTKQELPAPCCDDLLEMLPHGENHATARVLSTWLVANRGAMESIALPVSEVSLLTPIPNPPKILLLAGNYAEHIREGGGIAVERQKSYPYLFMKPASTTLNHPGAPVILPSISPHHIDWEVELGVIIGKRAWQVKEADALKYVAGYTVMNDVSDRSFKPNPGRQPRQKDSFFDWQHGKWHEGFLPAGPCILPADVATNPQSFHLTLKVNGKIKQDATTAQMIYSVAATLEFISAFVVLEPGDMISTGTPAGVGHATGTYLKPGDVCDAAIDGIGVLRNTFVAAK